MIRIEYGRPDFVPCELAPPGRFTCEPFLCRAMNELVTLRPASEQPKRHGAH